MIALVDYGMGNLRSVEKALLRVGGHVKVVRNPDELTAADSLVLPGVGAFADCMRNLKGQGLLEPLKNFIASGRPFLGICLGYQALFEGSEEGAGIEGLGIYKGSVLKFPANGLKVPQIGWNRIQVIAPGCPLLQGIEDGSHVYFVHSYFPEPKESSLACTRTEYGLSFASMVWKDNVYACQFHPEKSQGVGLKILENFVRL